MDNRKDTYLLLLVNTHILLHIAFTICLHSQNVLYLNLYWKALQETLPTSGFPIFGLRFGLSKNPTDLSISYELR